MKYSSASTVVALLTLVSTAAAHFTLDYPLTRGFNEDIENDNFCGGFPNPLTPRQPWYYKNGPVAIDSHHDSATVNIYISYDVPTSAQSFLNTTSGVPIPPLRNDVSITGRGKFCFHANATGVEGVKAEDGQFATIMVEYINNNHGRLYQCSDVVFTDDASVGSNITCTDSLVAAGAGANATSTANSTSTPAPASSASATPRSGSNGVMATSIPMLGFALVPALLAGAVSLI